MGFLRRLLGSQSEPTPDPKRPPTIDLGDQRGELPAGGFALLSGPGMEVVGESHYRDAIAGIAGGTRRDAVKLVTWAALVPEPENQYDGNAVGVRIGGVKVGHLSRDDAAAFAPVLARLTAAGLVGHGRADIYGGWDRGPTERGDYGITLYVGSGRSRRTCLTGHSTARRPQRLPRLRHRWRRDAGVVPRWCAVGLTPSGTRR